MCGCEQGIVTNKMKHFVGLMANVIIIVVIGQNKLNVQTDV